MASIVTERFVRCIEHLKDEQGIKSLRQFSIALDYYPQNMNEIYNGKRDATIDLIKNAIDIFHFNPTYIFTGNGPMFLGADDSLSKADPKAIEKIVYVPMAAHAGYTEQFNDPLFVSDLISFSLPDYKFQRGTYRCFDIVGDSMEPSLYAGDKVVCSLIDLTHLNNSLRNNYVYVVILQDGIVAKRIQSDPKNDAQLMLVSDNDYYKPYPVDLKEIKEVWFVEVKISPFLPSPKNIRKAFHTEMDSMRSLIESQSSSIQSLNQTVEKLLKQNRAVY